ncbi:restriction endonuclease subunit S [Zhouia amylolytica]|uniref:restriction endonuclease subunit S n=1 Tax=Zhouia amylolytica TaxID=376730 RepID=UPI0020CDE4B5|nr:restriction endonuclease subunit S [Zhouia amylolytica]MCQ0113091.1 restriction endonuclease subunit S [Zhouia amylolytica]
MNYIHNRDFTTGLEQYATLLEKLAKSNDEDYRETFFENIKEDRQLYMHYTPNQFSSLITNSVSKTPKSVLDPCCGLGNILYFLHNKFDEAKLTGIEINTTIAKITQLLIPDAEINSADALVYTGYSTYDLIVANIPLGLRLNYQGKKMSSEEAFTHKALELLNETGEVFLFSSNAFLTTTSSANVRASIMPNINAIVVLPVANPAYSSVKRYVVHLTKKQTENIHFGEIDKMKDIKNTITDHLSLTLPKKDLEDRLNPEYYLSLNSDKYDFIDEFETKNLEDLTEIIRGAYIKQERKKVQGNYLLIRPIDIKDNTILVSEKSRYINVLNSNAEERALAQPGDILISTVFNQGKIYRVKQNDPPIVASNNMVILRGTDNDYLKVYFDTEKGREIFKTQTEDLQTGAVIPQISISSLKRIKIPIFPIEDISSWGDDAIEHADKEELEQLKEQVEYYKTQLEEHKRKAVSIDGFKQILENRDKKILEELQKIGAKLDSILEMLNAIQDDFTRIKSNNRDNEEKIFLLLSSLDRRIKSVLDEKRKTIEEYELLTQRWLHLWEELHPSSKKFLPLAEFLYDELVNLKEPDFSPFVLQYCRTLENEILIKLFQKYHSEGLSNVNIEELVTYDIENATKAAKFALYVKRNNTHYPLGDMHWILNLMKPKGSTYKKSLLLQHFRAFCTTYFQEEITSEDFLNQIQTIQKEYRNKAAHVSTLDLKSAEECRDLLRKSLNQFLEMKIS